MKYNVGDKVKVREGLKCGEKYGGQTFYACNMKGKVCTIKAVCSKYYFLKEDTENWCWTDEMLEEIKEERTIDVGYHLGYCGHRVLKDVIQSETGINRIYYTKNYDIQYIIPIDAIDFIIPHED